MSTLGIAVASGMLKGVFGHGVLSAFEEAGLRADCYGAASSSILSCGMAIANAARTNPVEYWQETADGAVSDGMSAVVRRSIAKEGPLVKDVLFTTGSPRLLIATSRVTTESGAASTQGDDAATLGMTLLTDVVTGNRSWVAEHLVAEIYDSRPDGRHRALTPANFDDVAYASTRMLHALDVPASVEGEAHVDASYTCSCPAREVAEQGVDAVIAVSCEHKTCYRDLYRTERIVDGTELAGARVFVIRPPVNLASMGVDFASATPRGLSDCYELGVEMGEKFLAESGELVGLSI